MPFSRGDRLDAYIQHGNYVQASRSSSFLDTSEKLTETMDLRSYVLRSFMQPDCCRYLTTRASWPEMTGASSRSAYEAILYYETSTCHAIESTAWKHIYHRTESIVPCIFWNIYIYIFVLFLSRKGKTMCVYPKRLKDSSIHKSKDFQENWNKSV